MISPSHLPSLLRRLLPLVAILAAWLAIPSAASADTETYTYKVPIKVAGYEVKQEIRAPIPEPNVDGYVTRMHTDIVDASGDQVPISRLMLHHIVYVNINGTDATCAGEGFLGWDSRPQFSGFAPERFFAAGEERARLQLPDGYGYELEDTDNWATNYMVMNHRKTVDEAFIEYTVTVDDDPDIEPVTPYWFDSRNCRSDPIYNVKGHGDKGSTDNETTTFTMPEAGRIIAGGGHTHGGARKLELTQPDCDDRRIGQSLPTWGNPDHPFYNVKPVLHEPGPIDMSGFWTETGIPIAEGERIRLNSKYEDSRPHVRVMGIFVTYIAHDASVTDPCGAMPDDIFTRQTASPGRHKPVPYRIPIYDLNDKGDAVRVNAPPGRLEKARSGVTVGIEGREFTKPNLQLTKGSKLNWRFDGPEVHNITLANGPVGIGSPNLNDERIFSKKLRRPGTYRFFCALHPVQMTERVEVVKKRKKG